MDDQELDVLVAKAMGWRWDDDWGCLIPPEQIAKPDEMWTDWQWHVDGGSYRVPVKKHYVSGIKYNGNLTKVVLPHYITDIAAARVMEDWLEGKGPDQIKAYTTELCSTVGYNHHWTNLKLLWAVAHATPEQRCLAFLKAMGVETPVMSRLTT